MIGNDRRFHMNTLNSVAADSENTSQPSIWALAIKFMFRVLNSYILTTVVGPLEEFKIIQSNLCDRYNDETRAKGRQLWTRTMAAYHATCSHRDTVKLAHPGREHAPASTIMPRAAGRQSGQRRPPRRGGQAKKSSNDPDGGDGEPPRPPRSLPSSRPRTPPFRYSLTRPVIAGGAR